MSLVKSLSVGNGDMFYIRHGSGNFSIIDCCLSDDNEKRIVDELLAESALKTITRFISTHPDEDHVQGIEYLDARMPIANFYCVENAANKDDETDSFLHYCSLRDGSKAFYVTKGCTRLCPYHGIERLGPDVNKRRTKTPLESGLLHCPSLKSNVFGHRTSPKTAEEDA